MVLNHSIWTLPYNKWLLYLQGSMLMKHGLPNIHIVISILQYNGYMISDEIIPIQDCFWDNQSLKGDPTLT